MRSVSIKIHYVDGTYPEFAVPVDELRALYRTALVDLIIVPGGAIPQDPRMESALLNYDDWVRQFGLSGGTVGHLIIGGIPPFDHPEIAGQLLAPERRGVAVVYTENEQIRSPPEVCFLQTCAHEIGHLLNLPHPDDAGLALYDSTMNQLEERLGDVGGCWEAASLEASEQKSCGKPDYFLPPSDPLGCYPFSLGERTALNTNSDNRFYPWGSNFDGVAESQIRPSTGSGRTDYKSCNCLKIRSC
jgi:hypothetical protein